MLYIYYINIHADIVQVFTGLSMLLSTQRFLLLFAQKNHWQMKIKFIEIGT